MTPAIRVAEAAGIDIGLHHYEHDPTNRHYGLEAAEALGVSPDSVFKTLVLEIVKSHRSQHALAVIPVSKSLSLKAAAAALGYKNAVMAAPENAERVTGYTRGGISPLGTRSRLETVLDSSSSEITRIYCSGGKRGLDISIAFNDLVRLTDATIAPIAK
ncbi:MAG: Cys-tRNA(Pro) deacylase [Acidimicrobiales bacterium]|jgi:Cys-tRNA(Pro)/Cys-tRNA(Cys) deacylase|nr:Cys-tRNA(Pro) deacylase [Acidimicrobiales bacterium]